MRWVCIGTLLCGWAMVSAALDSDYSDRMLFADGLFAREMYDLARHEYTTILAAFPEGEANDAAMFRLAESQRHLGDMREAGRYYGQLVAQFRESTYRLRAAYRRARLYADAGDLVSAQAHFEAILGSNPEPDLSVAAQYYLGDVLFRQDRFDAADVLLAQLLSASPDTPFTVFALLKRAEIRRSRLALGGADADAGHATEALAFYRQALSLAQEDSLIAEVLFQKAGLYFRQEAYAEAAARYRRLIRDYAADPRATEARLQAAWSALYVNRYAEALQVAQQAYDEAPDGALADEWLYVMANSQRQLLQTEAATTTYATLLARYPEGRFADAARYESAVAHYKAGAFAAAIRDAEQIPASSQLRQDVNWLLAESHGALDRSAEAVQYYQLVVQEAGVSERVRDALYRLAHHLQRQGNHREAARFYQQMVETFPDAERAPQALFAAGVALAQAGSHEEAVRDWGSLVQRYPADALVQEALYQKAMGEIRLERYADALTTLAELQRQFPESRYQPDSLYWQGMLHYQAERFAEALPPLQQALALATREELRRDVQFQLGLVLQRLGKDAEATRMFEVLVDSPLQGRFPPVLLEWLALQHYGQGAFARMEETAVLLAGMPEPPSQQAGWVLVGRARQEQANLDGARIAFRKALEIAGRTAYAGEAALRLGQLYLEAGELDEAQVVLRQAAALAAGVQADAIRARALIALGKAVHQKGALEEATRLFLSVGILYDDPVLVPESLYLAALLLAETGRTAEQASTVAELQQRYPDSEWAVKARAKWPT